VHNTANLFKITKEETNDLSNFLDITIMGMEISTNRNPTTADCIIPNNSVNPLEHKLAAIRSLENGVNA